MFVKFVENSDDVEAELLDLKKQREQIGQFTGKWDERKERTTFNSGAGDFGRKLRELIDNEDY